MFGVPDLGLNWREEAEAIEMKRKLMAGEETTLKPLRKQAKQIFPPIVKEIAEKFWLEITVTDPGKHKRIRTAVKDGEETVPTRYQTTTNEEAYISFKESASNDIGSIMSKHAEEQIKIFEKRVESRDKQYRLQYARDILPKKFPGCTWFIEQRPPEIKMMCNHTTGLCKVIVVL